MNTLQQKINEMPSSMLEAEDVEEIVLEAQQMMQEYDSLSLEEKKNIQDMDKIRELLNGNSPALDPEYLQQIDSPLKDKYIAYLGSSITLGMKSENVSFAEYIGQRTGCHTIKQAISGATLAYKDEDEVHDYRKQISYIKQLINPEGELFNAQHLDILLVQLSTNDTTMDISLGEVYRKGRSIQFDYSTVIGAIEYIILFAIAKWNCKVVFYTNPYIQPEEYSDFEENDRRHVHGDLVVKYQKMVDALYEVQKKWPIGIIDLWNEPSFRNIDLDVKRYYMADIIHPYKSGYLFWYAPFLQKGLETLLLNRKRSS